MDKVIGGSIALALIVIAITLMALAWRARTKRASGIALWEEIPGEPLEAVDVFYVATTQGGSSLERVALKGLTFRGFATLEIFPGGIQVRLTTGDSLNIPAHSLTAYEFAQVAIDKVVEKDGLIALSWTSAPSSQGTSELTTYVRLRDVGVREHLTGVLAKLVSLNTKEEVV
jgi:hypothetical protein